MADPKIVREQGEGTPLWFLNSLYVVKASSEETGGQLTAMEMTIPPGAGPPPHVHDGGETVYVLEGQIRYHIGDEVYEAGPGAFFHLPAGTLENFAPVETARLLVIYTPGGIDQFFNEVGEPAQAHELPLPSDEPPDLEALQAVAAKYGLELRAPAEAPAEA